MYVCAESDIQMDGRQLCATTRVGRVLDFRIQVQRPVFVCQVFVIIQISEEECP